MGAKRGKQSPRYWLGQRIAYIYHELPQHPLAPFITRPEPNECVVCGASIKSPTPLTCGSVYCASALEAMPYLTDNTRRPFPTNKMLGNNTGKKHSVDRLRAVTREQRRRLNQGRGASEWVGSVEFHVDRDWYENNPDLSADETGCDLTGKDNPFSPLHRHNVGLVLLGGAPAITVHVPPRRSVFQTLLDSGLFSKDRLSSFEICYAWRCTCPRRHVAVFLELTDFPSAVGYHHACPACGQAPLEIIRQRRPRNEHHGDDGADGDDSDDSDDSDDGAGGELDDGDDDAYGDDGGAL